MSSDSPLNGVQPGQGHVAAYTEPTIGTPIPSPSAQLDPPVFLDAPPVPVALVYAICTAMGIDPHQVASIEINPGEVIAVAYRVDTEGKKIAGEDGPESDAYLAQIDYTASQEGGA